MAFDGDFLALREKGWIPIRALSRQDNPTVKSLWITSKMPFADHARVVASGLHVFGNRITFWIKSIKDRNTIQVRVLPGEQGGATRSANGVGHKGLGEASPSGG